MNAEPKAIFYYCTKNISQKNNSEYYIYKMIGA